MRRVVLFSRSYGYRGDLMYFGPLLAGLAAALPGTVVPVDRDVPTGGHPDVPLLPVLSSLSLPLPSRRGEEAPTLPVPGPGSVARLWRTRPDVAVCIEFTPIALLGAAMTRLRGGRVLLLVENDPRFRGAPASGAALLVKRRAAALATRVLVSNEEGARYVREDLGVPADRVLVGPYLTSAPPSGPVPAPPLDGPVRLLFLNSVTQRKGVVPLVRALAGLGDAVRPWRLDVVGDGPQVEEVRRTAAELGVADAVRLHGAVAYAGIWDHYAACHVVVCPTDGDYRSLAGIEAVTSGRPALLSVHDGAAAELARAGAAVVLHDPRTPDGLPAALRGLLGVPGAVEELVARAATPPPGFAASDAVDTLVDAVRTTAGADAAADAGAGEGRYRVRRIVHVYLRPGDFGTGGVNRAAQHWAARMAGRTGLPTVYAQARGGFDEQLVQAPGLTFTTLRTAGRGRQSMLPRGLGALLRRGDLVYLHEGWTPSNLAVAAACRRRGIPYVVMPHGVYERSIVEASTLVAARSVPERAALHRAAGVHLYFDSERDHLAAVAPRARAFAAPTGRAVGDGPLVAEREPWIAWLGRYDIRHKGIDVLLRAVASLPPARRPRLRMVGQDHLGDRARVRSMVEDLGLAEHVSVEDELPHDEAGRFLARARAFVHTPRWECLPTTVLEALEAGTPTVLAATAHVAELLGGVGAVDVVPLEPADVAAALERAWTSPDDPAAAERRRDALAAALDWDASLDAWAAALRAGGLDLPAARTWEDRGAAPDHRPDPRSHR